MNLLLLEPEELATDGVVRLSGRRAQHAREVLRVAVGQPLRVGVWRGAIGTGEVVSSDGDSLVLHVALTEPPPRRPGVDVLLALPRPKALKKVIPSLSALGVDRVVLLNAARVEKSYFDSKVLAPDSLGGLVRLGLEQARDTCPPEILIRERFRPFVEDELAAMFPGGQRLIAHPTAQRSVREVAGAGERRLLVAIGPEGGWVPFELELLGAQGFEGFSLGARILRVETAVPYVLGALVGGRG
jgi:RsmE family RNA methyltransferase